MSSTRVVRRIAFTAGEIRTFRVHAIVVAAIAAGMLVVAPKGIGQFVGVPVAVVLLPLPPLVIYLWRRAQANRPPAPFPPRGKPAARPA